LLFGDGIALRWYDAEVERMATGGIVCRFLSDDDGEAASTEGAASNAKCKKKRKSLLSVGWSTMVPWDDIDARVKIVRQATVTSKKSGVDAINSSSGFASNSADPSYYGWKSQPDAPLVAHHAYQFYLGRPLLRRVQPAPKWRQFARSQL